MKNLEYFFRSIYLMYRTMNPTLTNDIVPEVLHTDDGYDYHVFSPIGKSIRTIMIIYGMTIGGPTDARLVKFAKACTEAGLKVIIPDLPGLNNFRIEIGDFQRVTSIGRKLGDTEKNKIGLIGFSTGGSYALLLAGQDEFLNWIGPIVLFSPIYEARLVADRLHAEQDPYHKSEKELDGLYWAKYVIAYRNPILFLQDDEIYKVLQKKLLDYDDLGLDTKREFYEILTNEFHLENKKDLFYEDDVFEKLSAKGNLLTVRSPVFIIHDVSDQIVLPEQSIRMFEELSKRGIGYQQKLLVTQWLSHVVMQKKGSIAELVKFITLLSEIFQ